MQRVLCYTVYDVVCLDRRIGKRYGLSKRKRSVPDHILVVQPRQQLHFAGDLSSKVFAQRIQWNSLNGVKTLIQLVAHLLK